MYKQILLGRYNLEKDKDEKKAVCSTDATLVQQALEHVPKLLRLDKLSKQSKPLTLLHEIGFNKVGTRINGLGTIGVNEGRCFVE